MVRIEFDGDVYRLSELPACPDHGKRYIEIVQNGPHRQVCCANDEHRWGPKNLGFIRKKKNENSRRPKTRDWLPYFEEEGVNACQWCGRTLEMLKGAEHFTQHHIHPLDEGGLDVRDNVLLLCSRCHVLQQWCQLTMRGRKSDVCILGCRHKDARLDVGDYVTNGDLQEEVPF